MQFAERKANKSKAIAEVGQGQIRFQRETEPNRMGRNTNKWASCYMFPLTSGFLAGVSEKLNLTAARSNASLRDSHQGNLCLRKCEV